MEASVNRAYIYEPDPRYSWQDVEFTPYADSQLDAGQAEEMALRWFRSLQAEGVIPPGVKFNSQVRGSEDEISYRDALTQVVSQIITDQDQDGLRDISLSKLVSSLQEAHLLPNNSSQKPGELEDKVRAALLSRASSQDLRASPPDLTLYLPEPSRPQYTTPLVVRSADALTGITLRNRFAVCGLDPYNMADAITYFHDYAETHSRDALRLELAAYLGEYYIHAADTPLGDQNVSDGLALDASSVLTRYFTRREGRLVIDCNLYAEVANAILQGVGLTDTAFVAMHYFDGKGHAVLLAKVEEDYWMIDNDEIRTFDQEIPPANLLSILPGSSEIATFRADRTLLAARQGANCQSASTVLLESPSSTMRTNAAVYLSLHGGVADLPAIISAIEQENDVACRYFAVLALGGLLERNPTLTLPENDVARLTVRLGQEKDADTRLVLLEILHEENALSLEDYLQGLEFELSSFPAIKSNAEKERFSKVIKLLAEEGEAGAAILKAHLAAEQKTDLRVEMLCCFYAQHAISETKYARLLAAELDRALADNNEDAQGQLIRLLAGSGEAGVEELFLYFDGTKTASNAFRLQIISCENLRTNPAAASLSVAALKNIPADNFNKDLADNLIDLLYFSAVQGNNAALDTLLETLAHPNSDVRFRAFHALRKLKTQGCLPAVYQEKTIDALLVFLDAVLQREVNPHNEEYSTHASDCWTGENQVSQLILNISPTAAQREALVQHLKTKLATEDEHALVNRKRIISLLAECARQGSTSARDLLVSLFDEAESEKISGGSPSECELQEYKIYLAKELASIDSLTPSTRKRVKKFLQQTLQRTSRLSRNAYTIQVRDAAEDALRALEAPSITFY